jgi:hypothetical protein
VAGFIAGEDLPVSPFGGEGAVEAFDLAVGTGAVRFDEALLGAELGDGGFERGGMAVGEGVIPDDAFDAVDAVAGEELGSAEENGGSGGAFFVVVDFGVGEARVIVDDGVDVVKTDSSMARAMVANGLVGIGAPAATVGDAAEFVTSTRISSPGRSRS